MGQIPISQSLIKKFEEDNYCPKKIYHCNIIKTHQMPTSDAMVKGSYFETMVIGSGAHNSMITDLPRLKNGKKSTDHERIDLQVERFDEVLQKYGISKPKPENCQIEISIEKHGFLLNMTLDFAAKMNHIYWGEFPVAIIDLKLTKDRMNSYGDFCWGTPENMDHLQPKMYTYGFREHFSELKRLPDAFTPPFFYLVFDYKPDFGDSLIKIDYDRADEEELFDRIEKADYKIKESERGNWQARPDYEQCKKCPLALSGDCKEAPKIEF
jgi:hypothetical protein